MAAFFVADMILMNVKLLLVAQNTVGIIFAIFGVYALMNGIFAQSTFSTMFAIFGVYFIFGMTFILILESNKKWVKDDFSCWLWFCRRNSSKVT